MFKIKKRTNENDQYKNVGLGTNIKHSFMILTTRKK